MGDTDREVRATAICVVLDAGRIFVFSGYDKADDETFYRPLGGGIEFGETGLECIQREMLEEIGAEVVAGRYLGTVENIFSYEGVPGHQIMLVYEARFSDPRFYEIDSLEGHEDMPTSNVPGETKSSANAFMAHWIPLADFRDGSKPLYPEGLLELIDNGASGASV